MIDFPSSGVHLMSWVSLADLGGISSGVISGNDCWGYVAPSGREYAILGHSSGTAFVEISDPTSPVIVADIDGPDSLWRDIKTYGSFAYAVSEGGSGVQIIDLSGIDAGIVSAVGNIGTTGTPQTHNVAVDETSGFLYRCGGGSRGLRIYDLANPASPDLVGTWSQRYVHDAQIVTYESGPYFGRQIAFCCSGFGNGSIQTGLTILDVTDKSNIEVMAQFHYPNARYSHQAWLSEDRQYLYLDDELDEGTGLPTTTHVIDVADLTAPFHVGSFDNGNTAIGHNLYTNGGLLYEANYRSGLHVYDLADPEDPEYIAYFDTYPGDDIKAFNGMWGVFPFFPSGLVIGSDLEKGLFVWWVGETPLSFDFAGEPPALVDPDGGSFVVEIAETSPGELMPGTAMLYYDLGDGILEAPLTDLGGGSYRADFPAIPCGRDVAWFVGARSSNGFLWTDPPGAPAQGYRSVSGIGEFVLFDDDMESNQGWVVGAPQDDASGGVWQRVDPMPNVSQPSDDHSPDGTRCWVTNNFSHVDRGRRTVTSPRLDLSGMGDPIVSFWVWFAKSGGTHGSLDRVRIMVSNDDGDTWVPMEHIRDHLGFWAFRAFHVADFVEPSDAVRVRFIVKDYNFSSITEAAVDDFRVTDALCDCATRNYCVSTPNSFGDGAVMGSSGSLVVADNDFRLTAGGAIPGQGGFFYYGAAEAAVPFGEGVRCVAPGGAGISRLLPLVQPDGSGFAERPVDFSVPPASSGPGAIVSGSTWKFQFWYRDPAGGGTGFNLSDGLSVTFCP
jgi:choice-of-anchor B domain-containing protein